MKEVKLKVKAADKIKQLESELFVLKGLKTSWEEEKEELLEEIRAMGIQRKRCDEEKKRYRDEADKNYEQRIIYMRTLNDALPELLECMERES